MSDAEELYRRVILAHSRQPGGLVPLVSPEVRTHRKNPTCGDEVTLEASFRGDTLHMLAWSGQGCALFRASASIMHAHAQGKTRGECQALLAWLEAALEPEPAAKPPCRSQTPLPDEFQALAQVRHHPARRNCVLLPWQALAPLLNTGEAPAPHRG